MTYSPELNRLANKVFGNRRDSWTYEVAHNEPLHPDPDVVARMREVGFGNCPFGCKIYADPRSAVRVLAHNSSYGCSR